MDLNRNRHGLWKTVLWLGAIALLLIFNVKLISKNFLAEAKDKLPQIKLNVFSAGSFVINNPNFLENGTADSFRGERNILVLGKSGSGHIAPDLTDTILIIRLDGKKRKIKTISVPRDLAVKIGGAVTKINALYQIGSRESEVGGLAAIKEKVEEVTGLAVDNFVLFDLATVEKVIDDIGGLNVRVQENILDTRFPTDRGGYEIFKLEDGFRYLDGKTALKYVRTRNSPRGDFDRMERQQEVLKTLKGKILSLNPIWDFPKLWGIFRTVQKDIRTDLSLAEIRDLWGLAKNTDLKKIETLNLSTDTGLVASEKMKLGAATAYVLLAKPKPFDYAKIQQAIRKFIGE